VSDIVQEDFWSANPCGSDGDFQEKAQQRDSMEHWIRGLLREVAATHQDVLEVGCGQGIEAYHTCSYLNSGCSYTGIDYSEASIRTANGMRDQAKQALSLNVDPMFMRADALNLPFTNDSFDGIYSVGVLHHTPDPARAVAEIHRVLQPDGTAYVALYRKFSPKVGIAKALRFVQAAGDKILGTERIIYKSLERRLYSRSLGTLFMECFGVPYMYWYSREGITELFRDFEILNISPYGYNLPHIRPTGDGRTANGYFWLIKAKKTGN